MQSNIWWMEKIKSPHLFLDFRMISLLEIKWLRGWNFAYTSIRLEPLWRRVSGYRDYAVWGHGFQGDDIQTVEVKPTFFSAEFPGGIWICKVCSGWPSGQECHETGGGYIIVLFIYKVAIYWFILGLGVIIGGTQGDTHNLVLEALSGTTASNPVLQCTKMQSMNSSIPPWAI